MCIYIYIYIFCRWTRKGTKLEKPAGILLRPAFVWLVAQVIYHFQAGYLRRPSGHLPQLWNIAILRLFLIGKSSLNGPLSRAMLN